MKIINEYIVMDEYGGFFKVLELENDIYFRCTRTTEVYSEIGKDYFKNCKERFNVFYE